jgi:hypothetical protein
MPDSITGITRDKRWCFDQWRNAWCRLPRIPAGRFEFRHRAKDSGQTELTPIPGKWRIAGGIVAISLVVVIAARVEVQYHIPLPMKLNPVLHMAITKNKAAAATKDFKFVYFTSASSHCRL